MTPHFHLCFFSLDFEDDTAHDPTNPLSPDRYTGHPGIDHGNIPQATTAAQCPVYIPMVDRKCAPEFVPEDRYPEENVLSSEEDYMSMDHQNRVPRGSDAGDYAALKEDASIPEPLASPQVKFPRGALPKTQSESEAHGLETEQEYAVPFTTHKDRSGSTDEPSLEHSSSSSQNAGTRTLQIPLRLNLQTNTMNSLGTGRSCPPEGILSSSPFGTSPRRRPVPTPRTKKPRPASDGDENFLDIKDNLPRISNSESIFTSARPNGTQKSVYKKVPPPIPIPYHCAKRAPKTTEDRSNEVGLDEIAELSLEGRPDERDDDENEFQLEMQDQPSEADLKSEQPVKNKHYIIVKTPVPIGDSLTLPNSHGQELSSRSQTALGAAHNGYPIQDRVYENAKTLNPSPGSQRDLSPNGEDEFEDTQPIYDIPLNLPMPPEIPPEVLNQPPPSRDKLFGGSLSNQLSVLASWENASGMNDWPLGVEHVNAVNQLPNSAAQFVEPHEPFNPVGPANPNELVDPFTQPDDQVQTSEEGTYGEEIDGGIREIRRICGEELARDWCYAALLQYQGDVEQVVRIVKIQKLSKITGKSEGFCERTLTHCSWDLNRAAEYIFQNFEEEKV